MIIAVIVVVVVAVIVVVVAVVVALLSIYLEQQQHTNYSSCHFNRMTRIHQILKNTYTQTAEEVGDSSRERVCGCVCVCWSN